MGEGPLFVLGTLVASVCVSLVNVASQCHEQSLCLERGTCLVVDSWSCSFQNRVDEVGQRVFFKNHTTAHFYAATRGVCSPGQTQTFHENRLLCSRRRYFPNALNQDAVSTTSLVPHARFCGRWINSIRTAQASTHLMAFYDEAAVSEQVARAVATHYSVLVGSTPPSKFYHACERMVSNDATGVNMRLAFDYLSAGVQTSSRGELLRTVGWLARHYCDAPVQLALAFGEGPRDLIIDVTGGKTHTASSIAAQLSALGGDTDLRRSAASFADRVQAAPAQAPQCSLEPRDTQELLHHLPKGHTLGNCSHLSRLLRVYSEDSRGVHAYMLGMAAGCASSVAGAVFWASDRHSAVRTGLDQLKSRSDRLITVDASKLSEATSATFGSAFQQGPLVGAKWKRAPQVCGGALIDFFPDYVDEVVFDTLVSRTLYSRLGMAHDEIKEAVSSAIHTPVIARVLKDPSAVAVRALNVVTRVAGAPAGTWAGRGDPLTPPAFTSGDGALVMLLKASESRFQRRASLVAQGGVCSLPPLYPSTTRNAYLFPAAGCAMLLPGLLVPPFADELYDDESLYGRIGWVMAHEVSHVTATAVWDEIAVRSLLIKYTPSTHVEALADVVATQAIALTGKVNDSTLCGHLSQMWCGRESGDSWGSWASDSPALPSHPPTNARSDRMCAMMPLLAEARSA